MTPLIKRWLGQAARNPGPVLVIMVILAGLSSEVSEPLAWVLAAAALVALSQWLRVVWLRSRLLTLVVAVGLPALVVGMIFGDSRDPFLFLAFVPAILGLILEWVSRRPGSLLKAAPPGPETRSQDQKVPAPAPHGCRNLAILLGLFGAFTTVFFIWSLIAPVMEANSFKKRIRPGMTLSDVVITSFSTGRHLVFVRAEEDAPALRVGGSSAFVADESAQTENEVRALLDRRVLELRVNSLSFMFLSTIPVRSSILVRFGPDGRVTAVEGPFNWAS